MVDAEEASAATVMAKDLDSFNRTTRRIKRRMLRTLRRAFTAAVDARAKSEAYKTAFVRAEEAAAVGFDAEVLSLTRRAVLQARASLETALARMQTTMVEHGRASTPYTSGKSQHRRFRGLLKKMKASWKKLRDSQQARR